MGLRAEDHGMLLEGQKCEPIEEVRHEEIEEVGSQIFHNTSCIPTNTIVIVSRSLKMVLPLCFAQCREVEQFRGTGILCGYYRVKFNLSMAKLQ
jgi:hypothetical protein